MGYKLKVFAPYIKSANKQRHHKIIRRDEKRDENFVKRCYEEIAPDLTSGAIDEDIVPSEDFDFLMTYQAYSMPL